MSDWFDKNILSHGHITTNKLHIIQKNRNVRQTCNEILILHNKGLCVVLNMPSPWIRNRAHNLLPSGEQVISNIFANFSQVKCKLVSEISADDCWLFADRMTTPPPLALIRREQLRKLALTSSKIFVVTCQHDINKLM